MKKEYARPQVEIRRLLLQEMISTLSGGFDTDFSQGEVEDFLDPDHPDFGG